MVCSRVFWSSSWLICPSIASTSFDILKHYFLCLVPLLGMLLLQGQVIRVELLICGRVDDLRVYFLLVVVFRESAPVGILATTGRQADAVNIEGVELRCLLGWTTTKWHFSDLELGSLVTICVLRLVLSILLSINICQPRPVLIGLIGKDSHL